MLTVMLSVALVCCAPATDDITIDTSTPGGIEITRSATVHIDTELLRDPDDRGVIRITADDVTVDFAGTHLRGTSTDATPDACIGIGLHITGRNVTVRNLRVSGYKCGIYADGADGLVVEDIDVSDNFAQRLGSTPQREDASDWLWPHHNDEQQWRTRYGAGICVHDADGITIRRVRARRTQNGIIIDRVNDSRIYDNDCSFLSGWGLAMWRSNRNVITRNAFDFCIRGYSHGVYNRGQDSAGILMFEQCSDNVIAENSATHGGDGLFGFAGREALGQSEPPVEFDSELQRIAWYIGRGNNANRIIANDFSYAAAHGIEMTFSFDNVISDNLLFGNAICGIWGGYSQNTFILRNLFVGNGRLGYGRERGGINIENGRGNRIVENTFEENACGVFLWENIKPDLARLPWAKANSPANYKNVILANAFWRDDLGVQLHNARATYYGRNELGDMDEPIDFDEITQHTFRRIRGPFYGEEGIPSYPVYGDAFPIGARDHLDGRQRIIMTEWGPYAWDAPLLHLHDAKAHRHVWRLLGLRGPADEAVATDDTDDADVDERQLIAIDHIVHAAGASIALESHNDELVVVATIRDGRGPDDAPDAVDDQPAIGPDVGHIAAYTFAVQTDTGERVEAGGTLLQTTWAIRSFAYDIERADPREELERWYIAAAEDGVPYESSHLNLRFGNDGPSDLPGVPDAVRHAELPGNHFGTIAKTSIHVPAGRWRIRTVSDDGLRVWIDDDRVIDDWTHHAPREHEHSFTIAEARTVDLRVEHFELDGYAILFLDLEPAD